MDMKLEAVILPVADVDRSKHFYDQLGWRFDGEFGNGRDVRTMQFTPPGSPASVIIGKGLVASPPGSIKAMYLVVPDIEAARAELVGRGVEVSEVFHKGPSDTKPMPGPDPEHRSYVSFASFNDPDGNGWFLQEIRQRLPGR